MRRLSFAAVLAIPAVAACTGILGDFSVSTTSGDGGPVTGADATTGDDGAASNDGPTGDGNGGAQGDAGEGGATGDAADAGADVAVVPPLLECGEDMSMNPRFQLNANPNNGGLVQLPYGYLSMAFMPTQSDLLRVIAVEKNNIHAYTYTQNGGSVSDIVFTLNGGNTAVLDIQRYATGFALLVLDTNAASQTVLAIVELPDSFSAGWPAETVISGPNPVTSMNNLHGSLEVVNVSTGDYVVAVFDTEGTSDVLRGERVTAGTFPTTMPVLATAAANTYNMPSPSLGFDMTHAYVLLQPGSSGSGSGPSTANSAIYTAASMLTGSATLDSLMPPTGQTLYGLAMTNSVINPGSVDLAFIEGNLGTAVLSYYVGQTATTNLGSFAWQNLTQSTPGGGSDAGYGLEDLPVNRQQFHIETFMTGTTTPSENLLAIAQVQSVTGTDTGLNLVWWDAVTGNLRANKTGKGRLLSDLAGFNYSAVTFSAAPTAIITKLYVAYEIQNTDAGGVPGGGGNGGGQYPSDLWITQISCSTP